MTGVSGPVNDAGRLGALDSYAIVDTPAEALFDNIVVAATALCATPIGLVSLVGADRQWFKARVGVDFDSTPIEQAVCAYAVASRALLVIPDLTADPRTAHNPLVTGEAAIRFYAGAPLIDSGGHVLGTLCVIDTVARPAGLTALQVTGLEALARQTVALIEMRRGVHVFRSRTQSAQEAGRIGTFDFPLGSDMLRVSPQFCRVFGLVERHEYSVADVETLLRPEDLVAIRAARRAPGPGRQDTFYGIVRPDTGEPRWIARRARYEFDEAGRAVAMVGTVEDVTDRIEAEEQQKIVNQEISHRLKNALAVAQAIATQTLRRVADRSAVEALEQRLFALGSAHDVLMRGNWTTVSLSEVIATVVRSLGQESRVTLTGADVTIGSKAALTMTMLFHELLTNAMKYGARSVEGGRVVVSWRIAGEGDEAQLLLDWTEHDGPPAAQSGAAGFGSRLIKLGLVGTGGSTLRYSDTGFSAQFTAPLKIAQRA